MTYIWLAVGLLVLACVCVWGCHCRHHRVLHAKAKSQRRLLHVMRTERDLELVQRQQIMITTEGRRQALTQELMQALVDQHLLNNENKRGSHSEAVSKFRTPEDLVMGKVDDAARGLHARLGLPSWELYERLSLGVQAITKEYQLVGTDEEQLFTYIFLPSFHPSIHISFLPSVLPTYLHTYLLLTYSGGYR